MLGGEADEAEVTEGALVTLYFTPCFKRSLTLILFLSPELQIQNLFPPRSQNAKLGQPSLLSQSLLLLTNIEYHSVNPQAPPKSKRAKKVEKAVAGPSEPGGAAVVAVKEKKKEENKKKKKTKAGEEGNLLVMKIDLKGKGKEVTVDMSS